MTPCKVWGEFGSARKVDLSNSNLLSLWLMGSDFVNTGTLYFWLTCRDSGGGSNPTRKSRSNANSRNNSLNRAHVNNVHESMRLLQSANLVESDRDSRSTSSQSHCGGLAANSKAIAYTMSSGGGGGGGGVNSDSRRNSREKNFESSGLQHNHPVRTITRTDLRIAQEMIAYVLNYKTDKIIVALSTMA